MTKTQYSKTMTYQQLSDVLTGLGFQKRNMPEFIAFRHSQLDATIIFPQEDMNASARPLHLNAARATVIGKGVASADEFDHLLFQVQRKSCLESVIPFSEPAEAVGPKKRAKKTTITAALPALLAEPS